MGNYSKKKNTMGASALCDNLDFILHEEYRLLRTNIEFSISDEKQCHCIGITSSVKGEAKTTTAINLAYTLAENGEKVCLLEADMRLPTLAKKLNIAANQGLSNFLIGQTDVNECIRKILFKKCSFCCIQAGTLPPNPAELLSSVRMEKLLEALSKTFTYIIVDLPPVTVVSDAMILGRKLDGIVMAVAQPICTKRLLKEAMRQLSFADIKVLGFVRTFSTDHGFGYSKYGKRKYKYNKGYSKYESTNNKTTYSHHA